MSSDPIMYRWSQWLFLTLLDAGLIYHGSGSVDWCDTCQTTLATIQVEDGTCWRCHNPVRLIQRAQWYLRISAYLEENDRRIGELAEMGRDLAGQPALRAGPRGRGRAAGARRRRARADRVHPPRRGHRAGALRADLPQAPRGGALERRRRGGRAAGGDAPRRLGAQLARARRPWRWWTPAAPCRYPRAAHRCRC